MGGFQHDISHTQMVKSSADIRHNFPMSLDSLREYGKGASCGIFTQTGDSSHREIPLRIFGEQHMPTPICNPVLPSLQNKLKKNFSSFPFHSEHLSSTVVTMQL